MQVSKTSPCRANAPDPPVALVIDPEAEASASFSRLLTALGFTSIQAGTSAAALEHFHARAPQVVFIDFDVADLRAPNLLRQFQASGREVPVIVLTERPNLQAAFAAARAGAADILDKSASPEEVANAIRRPRQASPAPHPVTGPCATNGGQRSEFFRMYGQLFRQSEKMRALEQLVLRVAETPATVLVHGERGVGKGLVAQAIHALSGRSMGPWSKINCAGLPAELLETELFGSEDGPPGRLEQVRGGALLVEAIGEMPARLQSKFARLLREQEFYRVNGRELIRADVRVFATSYDDLAGHFDSGSFRGDLIDTLQETSLLVPPLRERSEEISSLVSYFLNGFAREFGRERAELSPSTMDLLVTYRWPGNVQELQNLIKRYVVLHDEPQLRTELQTRMSLVRTHSPAVRPVTDLPASSPIGGQAAGLRQVARQAARQAEQAAIASVLEAVHWNRAEAARRLKVSYKTLLTKLAQGDSSRKLGGSRRR